MMKCTPPDILHSPRLLHLFKLFFRDLVFILATRFPLCKGFNSRLSSHAHLGARVEYDSGGRLEFFELQVKTYPNVPVSRSLRAVKSFLSRSLPSVRLLNVPVKRWHEVNHLRPPVDSERWLVMMQSPLRLMGQIHVFFFSLFNPSFLFDYKNHEDVGSRRLKCGDRLYHKSSLSSVS